MVLALVTDILLDSSAGTNVENIKDTYNTHANEADVGWLRPLVTDSLWNGGICANLIQFVYMGLVTQ